MKLSDRMRAMAMATLAVQLLAAPGGDAQAAGAGGDRPVEAELRAAAEASAKKAPPEFAATSRKAIEEVAASGVLKTALNVGGSLPEFELRDAGGALVKSAELLARGPLVVVFYRGAWCPYCNIYLHRWQEYLPKLAERGATLVAISGESPEQATAMVKKTEATFQVLSDPGYLASKRFGVIYEVPKDLGGAMRTRGVDIKARNGTATDQLPLSATYLVGRDGKVAYAFLDADYKKRAEPADVLAALDGLGIARR